MDLKILKKQKTNHMIAIADYLLKRIETDEPLADKLATTTKTIDGAYNYVTKEAKSKAVNNCTCMTDDEVFGLVVHFFIEDEINEDKTPKKAAKTETKEKVVNETKPKKEAKPKTPKVVKAVAKQKIEIERLSLFDL